MKKPRILLDANPVVPELVCGKINGIGRTCKELINSLDTMAGELPFEIALYTQNVKGISAKRLGTGFKTIHTYLRNNNTGNRWSRRLHMREILGRYDVQHITHNYEQVVDPSRCIVTIHDVMFFSYPEKQVNPETNQKLIPPFVRKAKHIVTISENSKREIMQYMDVAEDRITVIPWGIDHNLLYPRETSGNNYCGNSPYFISVSCDTGRKNTISVVKAYAQFVANNPEHHLILVWRTPSREALDLINKEGISGKVHFASNISDNVLATLYAGATASFFPSMYEGFGLPIAESMACGVPCITCRNSSLKEVGGEAAIYVEPMDIDGMAKIMENFENNSYDLDRLKAESLKQAAKFTWDTCARKTIDVYRKCLEL